MSELKTMTRSKLTEKLNEKRDMLKKDVFMMTSIRPTKDGSLQVEVCQNRLLAGRKRTLLGALNRSDQRFGSATTLVFDWLKFMPEDMIAVFPNAGFSIEQLTEIAKSWKEGAPTGKDAIVHLNLQAVEKAIIDGEELTPVITVTEVTHSQLVNGQFFKGKNAEDQIAGTLENGNAVMRTGSGKDDEFLVHPETGERIYRFTRTEFKEEGAQDSIIPGKITESEFKKQNQRPAMKTGAPENLHDILKDDDSI